MDNISLKRGDKNNWEIVHSTFEKFRVQILVFLFEICSGGYKLSQSNPWVSSVQSINSIILNSQLEGGIGAPRLGKTHFQIDFPTSSSWSSSPSSPAVSSFNSY